tara:strand:- start:4004 stop:6700 length:2697 start_codon:yes stop_codon:yes gene_type:complete
MAVLSSLLGIGQQQPVAGPAIATTAFPAELAPYYKDILSKSQALYEDRTAEGYQPYQGPTMAEFTPEQQQAFTGIAGLAGQQAPKFAEAEQLTRQAAAPIATADIEQFMNPYQQAVVDIEKKEAQKQFEQKTLPSIRAAQVAQGAFGGTRGTLLEAQTLAEQNRLLSDIQARGSQQGFNQALQQAQAQRAREGQAAAQLATIAPQAFKAQLGELGAMQTVGEEKQRQAQTALNEAYKQFIEERQFPQQSLGQYQAVVQAQPASQMLESVQYAPPPPPLGQQLLGGLGTLVGTYGAFGGFSPGGLFGRNAKTGGGIEDLPIVEKSNGGGFFNYFQPDEFNTLSPFRQDLIRLKNRLSPSERKDRERFRNMTNVDFDDRFATTETTAEEITPQDLRFIDYYKRKNLIEGPRATADGTLISQEDMGTGLDTPPSKEDFDRIASKYRGIAAVQTPDDSFVDPSKGPAPEFKDVLTPFEQYQLETGKKSLKDFKGSVKDFLRGLLPTSLSKTAIESEKKFKERDTSQKALSDQILDEVYSGKKKDKSKVDTTIEVNKEIPSQENIVVDTKDKKIPVATVEDKTIIQQKPKNINKVESNIINEAEKQVEKFEKIVKEKPKDTKAKSSLDTARSKLTTLLDKQKDALGKQEGSIDDARRKSMFEFLAKVSSRYGQGENLQSAAAGELDSAMKRTRQLDQAALDLKEKQRQAEITAAKEEVGIEEKKAAAEVKALERRDENYNKYMDRVTKRINNINTNRAKIEAAAIKADDKSKLVKLGQPIEATKDDARFIKDTVSYVDKSATYDVNTEAGRTNRAALIKALPNIPDLTIENVFDRIEDIRGDYKNFDSDFMTNFANTRVDKIDSADPSKRNQYARQTLFKILQNIKGSKEKGWFGPKYTYQLK